LINHYSISSALSVVGDNLFRFVSHNKNNQGEYIARQRISKMIYNIMKILKTVYIVF